jgi:hypothetical protein
MTFTIADPGQSNPQTRTWKVSKNQRLQNHPLPELPGGTFSKQKYGSMFIPLTTFPLKPNNDVSPNDVSLTRHFP